MSDVSPFRPTPFGTTPISANTVQGAAPVLVSLPHGGGCQVRIYNRGSAVARIEFGAKPTMDLPTAASVGIPAGAVEIHTLQPGQRFVAVLGDGGSTPNVEFTVGEGN